MIKHDNGFFSSIQRAGASLLQAFNNKGSKSAENADSVISERNLEILKALGGVSNIGSLDACISKLRVGVRDLTLVNESKLKVLGAAAMMKMGNNLQIIFGSESDHIKEELQKQVAHQNLTNPKASTQIRQKIILKAPLSGRLLPLSQVPDPTFSQKILGDGFAIEPSNGNLLSPVDGTVVQAFRTGHAIGLETDSGVEILIHVGIDTVKMNGNGFKLLVQNGQKIKAGQALIDFDLELVKKNAASSITPIVFTNMERVASIHAQAKGMATAGEDVASLELQN